MHGLSNVNADLIATYSEVLLFFSHFGPKLSLLLLFEWAQNLSECVSPFFLLQRQFLKQTKPIESMHEQ